MRSCDLCARGTGVMQKKSHSQVKHKTHQKINVQTKRMDGGSVRLCSKCLKTITLKEKEFLAKQTPKSAKNVAVKTGKSYSAPAKTVAKKTAKK